MKSLNNDNTDSTAAPSCLQDLAGAVTNQMVFSEKVKGMDFEGDVLLDDIIASFRTTGIQATNLYNAIQEIKKMRKLNARIFLGATSNMISSGVRESIKYLAKNKYFEVMVITGGGVEEDFIKCMKPTYIGSFDLDGQSLRDNGWNRIGNMVINNENYMSFEEWFNSVMDDLISGESSEYPNYKVNQNGSKCYTEDNPLILTPSKFIQHLGKKINNEESVFYWCYKNGISVYSPAITDGSIGDLLTFYNKRSCFKLDIVEDIFMMNTECLGERANGAIILGGGLIKHHILNGNLFNDGLDYCVIINTAHEYDASDSGASITEAHSWGKIKSTGTCLKIHGDCSIIFPLIVYGAFKSSY